MSVIKQISEYLINNYATTTTIIQHRFNLTKHTAQHYITIAARNAGAHRMVFKKPIKLAKTSTFSVYAMYPDEFVQFCRDYSINPYVLTYAMELYHKYERLIPAYIPNIIYKQYTDDLFIEFCRELNHLTGLTFKQYYPGHKTVRQTGFARYWVLSKVAWQIFTGPPLHINRAVERASEEHYKLLGVL